MMDEIRIRRLEIFAHHGVYAQETQNGQFFYVNATLFTKTVAAGKSDDLTLSTNYGEVCLFIDRWMKENTYKLLEAAAEHLAEALLLRFPLIRELDLEIEKPNAPIPLPFASVSVKIHRGWHRAYLAVGSNMGDKKAYIEGAVKSLEDHPQIQVVKVSDMIETKPYGEVEQDMFLNGAIAVDTVFRPEDLLEVLHETENAAGRKRTIHWGPRTLDLDIIFYDDLVYEDENLTIPHMDMQNRMFVLEPLMQLCPGYRHPVFGKTVSELRDRLADR